MMIVIFCADPLDTNQVDSMYQTEADGVRALGFDYALINFEALVVGSSQQAVRRIDSPDSETTAIYRGWMLKPAHYQLLYDALLERNIRLINSPAMYRHCHYLPESYDLIADHTPRSVWLPYDDNFTMDAVHAALTVFGDKPIIVKDYVKSQKHYWHEACYIPNAADRQAVEQIVSRFLELQDTDLNEGLVFREFVEFQQLTQHSRSGMPLTQEYRLFVRDGQPVYSTKYWSEGDYPTMTPETTQFATIMGRVNSRFYTMDIARRADGDWMIVELGDGQVAGLPDHADVEQFYRGILVS